MDVLPLEQAKAEQMAYKDSTYVIVSKIAYLIGVPKRIFAVSYTHLTLPTFSSV